MIAVLARTERSNGMNSFDDEWFFHTPRSSQPELPERNCAGPRSYGGVEREVSIFLRSDLHCGVGTRGHARWALSLSCPTGRLPPADLAAARSTPISASRSAPACTAPRTSTSLGTFPTARYASAPPVQHAETSTPSWTHWPRSPRACSDGPRGSDSRGSRVRIRLPRRRRRGMANDP